MSQTEITVDPNFERKPSIDKFTQLVEVENRSMSFFPGDKGAGVGDTPDLISDETPPSAMLTLGSDSDLQSPSSRNDLNINLKESEKQEGPDGKLWEEKIKSLKSSIDLCDKVAAASIAEKLRLLQREEDIINNNCTVSVTDLGPLEIETNEEQVVEEKGSAIIACEFDVISREMASKVNGNELESGAVNAPDAEAPATKDEEYVDSPGIKVSLSPKRAAAPKTLELKSRLSPSTPATAGIPSTSSFTSAEIPVLENYATRSSTFPYKRSRGRNNNNNNSNERNGGAAAELLSKLRNRKSRSPHADTNLLLELPSKSVEQPTISSQAKVKPRSNNKGVTTSSKKAYSLNATKSRVWKGRESRSPSRESRTEERSKSPGRIAVEVHDRKGSVGLKSPDAKPVSPYECKVFPVKERKQQKGQVAAAPSFPANDFQTRLLDEELRRALDRDKMILMNAMSEYFKASGMDLPAQADHNNAGGEVDVDRVGGVNNQLSQRETYMSWLLAEKKRESESEGEGVWNPLANIFRQNRSTQVSTQVSTKPSFSDSQEQTDPVTELSSPSSSLDSAYSDATLEMAKKIRIVGQGQEDKFLMLAKSMYQTLKTVQKAIHMSDLFCFRNNAPELALGESLNQPEFQRFMDSGNEMEILLNLMSILGLAKENIELYLKAVQGADLITEKGSGLLKIGAGSEVKVSDQVNGNDPGIISVESSSVESIKLQREVGKETVESRLILSCPSLQSQISLRLNNNQLSSDRMLPTVHTFLEEQRNVTLGSYIRKDNKGKNRLVNLVMFNGHKYQIQYASCSSETSCGIQGIMSAHVEFVGEPTYTTLESLLGTIHRCTSHMDTRMACSCVWGRQSKKFMVEIIEKYLKKEYKPSTEQTWWGMKRMKATLRRFNVFAGIIYHFCGELVDAVSKLHFCMVMSLELLNKRLKDSKLPGFTDVNLTSSDEDDKVVIGRLEGGRKGDSKASIYRQEPDINENGLSISTDALYQKLKEERIRLKPEERKTQKDQDTTSIETLLMIIVLAMRDIDATAALGNAYSCRLKMPTKRSRRVLRFMNVTLAQLGRSNDVEFGALMGGFLSAVDKLSLFDEFMCEQKVEIRAKVNLICQQIIDKLGDLRCLLTMQKGWSYNLARNSLMRIKEINEIRRLRRLQKKESHIAEKMEMLRGTDASLMRVLEKETDK